MYLLSLETAVPGNQYTQRDCYQIFDASKASFRMKNRSADLMRKILLRNNGIDTRHFAYPDVDTIFDADPEKLNRVFEEEAPRLGARALKNALGSAGLRPQDLDGLIVCTCTGYLCPGLSSHIAEQTNLHEGCDLLDLVGMGCGAAIPSLRSASKHLSAHPEHRIAVVAVEICSAAFYLNDDPGVIISACLFGDGAAAAIWTGQPCGNAPLKAHGFQSIHYPHNRSLLRFENAGGALRNRLHKSVPIEAAKAVQTLFNQAFDNDLSPPSPHILPHTGGRDVLDSLESAFKGKSFTESRKVLQHHGNMSSPSILFVLKNFLDNKSNCSSDLWLTSFGAGFSAYACSLSRT